MAQWKVTYKCGHIGYVSLYGKTADREAKAAWIEENQECKECTARRNAEINRVAAEKAEAAGLPELTGSVKQVAWATTLRNQALQTIEGLMKNVSEEMMPVVKRTIVLWIADKTAASYWIDSRSWVSSGRLVCQMMDPYLQTAKAEIAAEAEEVKAEETDEQQPEAAEEVQAEETDEQQPEAAEEVQAEETDEEQPSVSVLGSDEMRDNAADAVVEWIKTGKNRQIAHNRVNEYMEFSGANTSPDGIQGAIARRRIVAQEILLRCITPLTSNEMKKAEEELYIIAGEISPANNGGNFHALCGKIREMCHCKLYSIDFDTVFDCLWTIVDLSKIKPASKAKIVDFGCYMHNYGYNQEHIEAGTKYTPKYTGSQHKKPAKGYEPDIEAIKQYSNLTAHIFEAVMKNLSEFTDLRKFTPKQIAEIMDFGNQMNIIGRAAASIEIFRKLCGENIE